MTYFLVDKSKDIPGGTSIFILTNQGSKVAEFIEASFALYVFDEKTSLYEISIVDLAFALDNLTYFDDIKLIIPEDEQNAYEEFKLTTEPVLKPKQHQLEAVNFLINHKKMLLLDAPGLGKTYSSILAAEELHKRGKVNHCLIICGIASLKQNWKAEIKKSSKLSCRINGEHISKFGTISYESMEKRRQELLNPDAPFFTIVNIESLRIPKKGTKKWNNIIKELTKGPIKYDMIVFDECHKSKDSESQAAKGLLQLDAEYKIAATGTYLLNSPVDAYLGLVWLGYERKRNLSRFQSLYCVFDPNLQGQVMSYKNLDLLRYQISQVSLRRTIQTLKESGVETQPKYEFTKYIEMNEDQQKFYKLLSKSVKKEYKEPAKQAADKIKLKTNNLLALTTRLRQATAMPGILTTQNISSAKIDYAKELVDQIVSQGDKVVILSTFKEPLHELYRLLEDYHPFLITGDSKEDYVARAMEDFQKNDFNKVWLGTHAKSGTGLTLNKAHYLIMIDTPWTAGLYEQSADRIYRINNDAPAVIYNLVCPGTIDNLVERLLKEKAEMSSYVLDEQNNESENISLETFQEMDDYLNNLED